MPSLLLCITSVGRHLFLNPDPLTWLMPLLSQQRSMPLPVLYAIGGNSRCRGRRLIFVSPPFYFSQIPIICPSLSLSTSSSLSHPPRGSRPPPLRSAATAACPHGFHPSLFRSTLLSLSDPALFLPHSPLTHFVSRFHSSNNNQPTAAVAYLLHSSRRPAQQQPTLPTPSFLSLFADPLFYFSLPCSLLSVSLSPSPTLSLFAESSTATAAAQQQ